MSQAGAKQFEKGAKPEIGQYQGFHHVQFWVGNAFQAAAYYCLRFGFRPYAYRGLETGHRDYSTRVIKQNNILLAFSSPYSADHPMNAILSKSGDGAHDVAFAVDDCRGIFEAAKTRGAEVVAEPWEESDEHGTVVMATVKTYGDTVHTFVQTNGYKGTFLPNFRKEDPEGDVLLAQLPEPHLVCIDHIVGNQGDGEMETAVNWYVKVLQFHRFWSVDDSCMHTEYSALRSVVVSDYDERVKMPINEPADGLKKSQIQEYVEYYGGNGVQHIALYTDDIINAISTLRARGQKFLKVPSTYYTDLRQRLADANFKIQEDMDVIEKLGILIDFDANGYLLQLFTVPQEDRPTLFYEIIQRRNHFGFGVGNFKALFQSIERAQAERGNL